MKLKSVVIMGIAVCALTGACGKGDQTATAQSNKELPKLSTAAVTNVNWYTDWDAGMAAAQKEKKPVLVHFTADWCVYCKKMKDETYSAPEIKERFNNGWITIMMDTESKDGKGTIYVDEAEKKVKAYKDGDMGAYKTETFGNGEMMQFFGGTGLPTLLFFDKTGEPLQKIPGFIPKSEFGVILDYFKDEAYKTSSFEDYKKNTKTDKKS